MSLVAYGIAIELLLACSRLHRQWPLSQFLLGSIVPHSYHHVVKVVVHHLNPHPSFIDVALVASPHASLALLLRRHRRSQHP